MVIRIKKEKITMKSLGIALILLYWTMPVVSRFISTYVSTYAFVLIAVALLFVLLFGKNGVVTRLDISFLFPFVFYELMEFFSGRETLIYWLWNSTIRTFLPITLAVYILQQKEKSKYTKVFVLGILVTWITTAVGVSAEPEAARLLATGAEASDPRAIGYTWKNIGGYGFVYGCILMYPYIILSYKRKRLPLIVTVILALALFALAIITEYTIALLFLIISSGFYVAGKRLKPKFVIMMSVAVIVAIPALWQYISEFLTWLSNSIGSDTMAVRIETLAGGTEALESFDDNRIWLYRYSIQTFLQNPLFGGDRVGGHSFVLDFLGRHGVLGVICLIWMYSKVYFLFFKKYQQKPAFGYVVWFFVQTILLSLINTGNWLNYLSVYSVMMLNFIYKEERV